MTEYDDITWELVDSHHPRYNVWRHIRKGYTECFWKREDPNKIEEEKDNSDSIDAAICKRIRRKKKPKDKHAEFNDELYARRMLNENIYKYVMFKLGFTYLDVAEMLEMDPDEFHDALEGLAFFTEDELTLLNKILNFGMAGPTDMRLHVNEKMWINKCVGACETRYLRQKESC